VPRTPVVTRTAVTADVPVLLALWHELREVGARAERAVNPVATPDVADRLKQAITRDDCRVVIAFVDDHPAGMAMFRAVRPDPLSDSTVLEMIHVVVTKQHRRRGVGHALVAAAADIADDLRIEHVSVGVYPSLREASRFYARLGFAQVMVRRVAPVGVLRRRLAGDVTTLRVDDLVRRRTRMRRPVPAQRLARRTEPVD
jgi:ribosomal protein S18 acetylase RimI-like enzyme